jgi:lipopolysaccharide biosynthesis protein
MPEREHHTVINASSTEYKRSNELPDLMQRLVIGDEILWAPERLVPFNHWIGHIPFAFWLVKVLSPRRLIELGTHRGNSYCAFCQAITTLRLDCEAYAVDTWQGDIHMSAEHGLLEELQRYHNPRYDSFSKLLEMTFDSARTHVGLDEVDLLHLDGTHTYDAVRHDFETWRGSLSARGIVLLHDIAVHQPEFGVWQFWREVSQEFPSFTFLHSNGLGVLGVGPDVPLPLQELFRLQKNGVAAARVRALFEARGQGLIARLDAEQNEVSSKAQLERFEAERARLLKERAAEAEACQAEQARLLAELAAEHETAGALKAAGSAKDGTIRNLRSELARVARDAADALLAAHVARDRLAAFESSTLWNATWPIRRAASVAPPGVRRTLRRAARLMWWTATLQLLPKMRMVREMNGRKAPVPAVPVSTSPRPTPTLNMRGVIPQGRLAAVMHLYYPELWPELCDALGSIPERFDLFVSITEGVAESAVPQIRASYPDAHIFIFPNHGRDILPFMALAATGVLNRYDLVCKLHAKRTLHRNDGDAWRRTLLGGVLQDTNQVQRIISAFEADPDLGIVVADGQIFGDRPEHWVDNRARVLELGARIGLEEVPDRATFPGGSIYWIRPFLLSTLVRLKLTSEDFEPEPLPRDGSTAHALERLVGLICADAGMRMEESSTLNPGVPSTPSQPVRIVAYYLPQFHPIPENDVWWGKGFTEWNNVTRAQPLFCYHRQPRLPADLGFYDLRMPEVREAQAELAQRYGVTGFCYYYYWFNGRGILRRPLDEMVSSARPDFPFMVCWANEPWSRNWDGGDREVLLPQEYAPGWARALARDIAPMLKDERYIRLAGRPMVAIYRIMHIPDRLDALNAFRDELRALGVGEVHIGGGWVGFTGDEEPYDNPTICGLDSWFEFPPHRIAAKEMTGKLAELNPRFTGKIYSYRSAIDVALAERVTSAHDRRHAAVMVGWDNTPRRLLGAHAFHGATPALFRRWLRALVRDGEGQSADGERLIFINAWNEWAEGAYLEPDQDFGHAWLQAVASATGRDMTRVAVAAAPRRNISPIDRLPEAVTMPMDNKQWVDLLVRSAELQKVDGVILPPLPARAWQEMFVGSSDAHAIREAAGFQELVLRELAGLGHKVSDIDRVLDFGCGWGRHIRLWMNCIPAANLFGADVDPDMIGFCRVSGLAAQFRVVSPTGPAPFEDGSFDLIYAYSVFSHLSEQAHISWVEEFHRILRPGGFLAFTTQARRFLAWTQTLRNQAEEGLSNWELSLRGAFKETDRAIQDYDSGRFVFAATGGGEYRPSSFYGEAAIPEAWLRARWGDKGLALRAFIDDPTRCPQAAVVMQKHQ